MATTDFDGSGQWCAQVSQAAGEPMVGTAPTAAVWLLVEQPGPWSPKAAELSVPPGVRVQLLRRHSRKSEDQSASIGAGVTCYLALLPLNGEPVLGVAKLSSLAGVAEFNLSDVHPGHSLSGVDLSGFGSTNLGPAELNPSELDLAAFNVGHRGPASAADAVSHSNPSRFVATPVLPKPFIATTDPLFLVCTHGRRDRCCAARGRPVAAAVNADFPDAGWETTHLGGHRFAANMVCFPHGYAYGRLTPQLSTEIARAYISGTVSLDNLRGRCGLPPAAQAAEAAVREHLNLKTIGGIVVVAARPDRIRLQLATAETYDVTLHTESGPPIWPGCDKPHPSDEGTKVEYSQRYCIDSIVRVQ